MYIITKTFTFEAAHQLEQWPDGHQCSRLHGHSYTLTVALQGPILSTNNKPGVLSDYGDVSSIVKKEIIQKWDHQFLNAILLEPNTTAEFLAERAYYILKNYFKELHYVEIKETASSSAIYYGGGSI